METDTELDAQAQAKEAARVAAIEAGMEAAGVPTTQPVQVDYFGFEERLKFVLPDKISFIEHNVLNEGQRKKYLNKVNRDVRVAKASGDAFMRMSTGDEKHALLSVAIVGWNLISNGQPINFSPQNLDKFLTTTNPKLIDLIYKEITKHNPWLLAEMTVEDIDKEIEALQEMRKVKVDEEEGKASS